MVERVARALFNTDNTTGVTWEDDTRDWERDEYRNRARAAIEAMREPTEAMLDAARDWSILRYGRGIGNDAARGCWQAMLDGMLMSKDERT